MIDKNNGELDTDRHWWPQAEALAGLFYALKIEPNPVFNDAIPDIWNFTKTHIIDHGNREWFFKIDENNQPNKGEDKLACGNVPIVIHGHPLNC